jgi:hypothetical protein
MDQARFVDAVFDANAKGLADRRRDAKSPIWLPDAIDRRRLAVDLDVAALKPQDRRRRSGAVGRVLRPGEDRRRGECRNAARKKCASGQQWDASSNRTRAERCDLMVSKNLIPERDPREATAGCS